jgi:peptidoglycan/LPS O-acetylase OafA/YrhL
MTAAMADRLTGILASARNGTRMLVRNLALTHHRGSALAESVLEAPTQGRAATLGSRFDPRANNFDLIRLFLAIVVIFSHCFALKHLSYEPIADLLHYGTGGELAVNCFLVISGFLVTRSACERDLDSYVLSRVARIVPGLALVTLVEVFVIGPIFSPERVWVLLTYVGFRHLWNVTVFGLDSSMFGVFADTDPPWLMNGSLWTIPVECSFYILLPFALAIPRRRAVLVLLFLASLPAAILVRWLSAARVGPFMANPDPSLFTNVHVIAFTELSSYFLFGAMAWVLRDRIPYSRGALALSLIGLYAAAGVGLADIALKIFMSYLVLYLSVAGGVGTRVRRRIGDLSYGLYLFGFPVTLAVIASTQNRIPVVALFFAVLLICAACAWVSWHAVERPALRLKRRSPGTSG